MTTTPTDAHEKARAFSTGFTLVINILDAATRQGLADDIQLTKLADFDNSISGVSDVIGGE
tara:strand:- start:1998 stop:2180 length:183 start_codon:yes stop_codon:yes gene_type:complete